MKAYWLDQGQDAAIDGETLQHHGVIYDYLGTDPARYQPKLDSYRRERGYSTQDEIGLDPEMENLDEICAKFDKEHLHTEDEARFVLDGEGIFDVRSNDDRWMRIVVEPGDLIIVPEDKHHRFLLTDRRKICCLRLFQDAAGWTPVYRS